MITTKTVTVSKNRQIAIPASFGINSGDKILITVDPKSQTLLIKTIPNPITSLRGVIKNTNYSTTEFLNEKKLEDQKRSKKLKLEK